MMNEGRPTPLGVTTAYKNTEDIHTYYKQNYFLGINSRFSRHTLFNYTKNKYKHICKEVLVDLLV